MDAGRAFEDRVVAVTGGARGIGAAIVRAFHASGARVVVLDKLEPREDIEDVRHVATDVSNPESVASAFASIDSAEGRIDVLVNNAGLGFARAAFDVSEVDWDEMMGVNLRGTFFMSQAVARTMVAAGRGGRIINISSQGGLVGLPDAVVYCASKGGVNMLTKTLALEWAKDAITVNAIAPTFIYTPGTAPILDEPAMRASVLGKIPLGKFALTEDVASAIIYLASEAGRMVTGTVLVVDGGWTAQ